MDAFPPVRLLFQKGKPMGKGNNKRGNKEAKKPKKEKVKISATSNSNLSKSSLLGTDKKGK
jgi:hypothetical protein